MSSTPHRAPGGALFRHPGVHVHPAEWGYGVFTEEFIPEGTVIEECHYLKAPWSSCQEPPLDDYVFRIEWSEYEEPRPGEWVAVVMGYGMIYNHSNTPNVSYRRGGERDLFYFYALRDIQPGEQLFISYGEAWWKTRGMQQP